MADVPLPCVQSVPSSCPWGGNTHPQELEELNELNAGTDDGKAPALNEVCGDFPASPGHSEPPQVTSEMHRIWEGLGET